MTKGTKIGIIVGVVVVLGVGGYFLYKKLTKDSGDGSNDENDGSNNNSNTNSNNSVSSDPATPFKNRSQGDFFRLWVNRWYPKYSKEIDLDTSGKYDNSTIRKAFVKYGEEYKQKNPKWDKPKLDLPLPKDFLNMGVKKDYYDIRVEGTIFELLPKIGGDVKVKWQISHIEPKSFGQNDLVTYYKNQSLWSTSWDETNGGKKFNERFLGENLDLTAGNFFELASKLKAYILKKKKSNFSSFDGDYGL